MRLISGMLLAAACGVAFGVSRHVLPVIYPKMQEALCLYLAQLGILTTAYFFSYTVAVLFFGEISDRCGSRRVVGVGCVLCAVGTFFIGFASAFQFILIASIIIGIGAGAIFIPSVSWVLRSFDRSRGTIISFVLVGEGLLGVSVGVIAPLLVDRWGWANVWRFFGLVIFALLPVIWLSMKERPQELRVRKAFWSDGIRGFMQLSRLKTVRYLGVVYFLHGFARGLFVTFSVSYLLSKGLSYALSSASFSFLAIGFLPGAIFSGFLSDKWNKKSVLLGFFVLEASSIVLLLFLFNVISIYGIFFVVGACLTGIPTVVNTFPPELTGDRMYGRVIAVLSFMYNVGVAVSPATGGYLGEVAGSLSFSLILALLFLSAGIAIILKRM